MYLYDGWHIYSFKTNNLDASKNSAVLKQWKFLNDISYPNINKYSPASHLFTVFEKYFACIPANMDSLFLYDMNGIKVSSCFFPFNKYPYVLWSQHISVIDSSRFLFLFHYTGFSIIPVTWQNNRPVLHQLSPVLFNSDQYNTALCDMQNNWWLATAKNGLQKISPYKQYFKGQSLIDKNSGEQIKSEINSLNKFNNTLWAASYGDGFFETDIPSGRQQQHRFYKTGDDIWANHVWNFHRVSDDTLWVGTQAGMFWYKISSKKFARLPAYTGKPAALDFVSVTTQFTDSHGLIWMGLGKGKGLCNFDDKSKRFTYYAGSSSVQGYPLRYPTCIAEDAHNNLWFVNDGSTVLVYWKRNTNQFQTINLPFATRKQIGNLNGIYCDGDSVLWLGSITCGLVKFNLKSNSITVYGHQNGLNNSHITSIFQDNKKRLWLADEGGLACFDEHTETFINYTPKEGLPVQYPSDYFYYGTAGNRLYAGGIGAFFYFNPDMIEFNHPPQKTYITAMKVNGKSFIIDKDQPEKLKPQQNDITIQYTAVDLTNGDETRYACKLIGED